MSNHIMPYKVAQFSPETEQAVLGCCLGTPAAFKTAVEMIGNRKTVFHEKKHAEIWAVLDEWYQTHDTHPDGAFLASRLFDTVGMDYVSTDLVNARCLPANIEYHVGELIRLWQLRTIRDRAGTMAQCADCGDIEGIETILADLNTDATDCTVDLLPVASCHDAPDPGKPLFKHGMPVGTFGLIIGGDGTGKSYIVMDLLLSCCLGKAINVPSLARSGLPLKCTYLSYEDPRENIRFRIEHILDAAGLPREMLRDVEESGRLTIITDAGPLFIQEGRDVPRPTDTLRALRRHITRNRTDLLVIDPLRAAAAIQNENDNSALNVIAVQLRRMAAETGTTVILVHHANKAAGRAGREAVKDHQIASGGGALVAACRWEMNLTVDTSDKDCLELAIAKNSYGKRLYGIMLARAPSNGVIRETSGEELGRAKERLMNDVIEYVRAHPDVMITRGAIKLRNSKDAKDMIDALHAKPADVLAAADLAIASGKLTVESRQRPGRKDCISILTAQDNGDDDVDEDEDLF